MADEQDERPEPTEPAPAPTPAPPTEPTPQQAESDRLARIEQQLSGLTDGFRAMSTPRQTQPGGTPGQIDPNVRLLLRQSGLSDADIDANAPLVMPFVHAMIGQAAPVIDRALTALSDDLQMVKAGRDAKNYPHWDAVEEQVQQLRQNAARNGQYLPVQAAYHAAVAGSVDAIGQRQAAARAASQSADLSAQHVGAHQGRRQATAAQPQSAKDLSSMTREQRKAFFDQHGDAVIE